MRKQNYKLSKLSKLDLEIRFLKSKNTTVKIEIVILKKRLSKTPVKF